ncbi:MAG: RNA methyltransferase [Polyangiaceae bacterium]|nr:RNA methyltransferase [Polyangiaceae bacterium]
MASVPRPRYRRAVVTVSQAELKRVRALQQKKARAEASRFLVQGRKVTAELLASTWDVEAIYATEDAAAFVADAARRRRVEVHVLPAHELERLGTFERGNELVAVAVSREQAKFRLPEPGELVLALDGVHDPRNLGGLLRIADWFGVRRVVCSQDCIEVTNPKVVQSTMGSLFRVQVRYAQLAVELPQCAAAGVHLYLADMGGASAYDAPLARPAVLVLGSESHGLSEVLRGLCAQVLSIPRVGRAESLNVAMAAAALCSEFARQAGAPK